MIAPMVWVALASLLLVSSSFFAGYLAGGYRERNRIADWLWEQPTGSTTSLSVEIESGAHRRPDA